MYFVHDTILDIGIGKSEENETGNEEGQTSGGNQLKFLLLDRTNGKGGELVQLGFNCTAHNKNN